MIELLAGPLGPLLVFVLRLADVAMATVRMTLIVRGQRFWPPVIGFVEILVWLLAAGAAVQNLSSPLHALGYAGGFASGTYVGLWLEGRLAVGMATVQVVSRERPEVSLAARLREHGFGVTQVRGQGRDGPVEVLYASVRRRALGDLLRTVEELEPDAFVSVQDDRLVRRGWMYARRPV
ncbi:MAG: DUF2179 domain-containing protein [Gemmatimonadota bacterium]